MSIETPDFRVSVKDLMAVFEMRPGIDDVGEARRIVDPFVKRWMVIGDLGLAPGAFQMEFVRSDPPPQGPRVTYSSFSTVRLFIPPGGMPTRYPDPQVEFGLTPEVEIMYLRYAMHMDQKEPLLSMANMCLTVLEVSVDQLCEVNTKEKRRERAAQLYRISIHVLRKLGFLVTERGDAREARKAPTSGYVKLTKEEVRWIQEVVRLMILRLGQYSANPNASFPEITMADLPSLGETSPQPL
jgi:hypothetical protein